MRRNRIIHQYLINMTILKYRQLPRLFVLLCTVFLASSVYGQRNMDSILVNVTGGKKIGALLHLPDDYNQSGKSYPLIVYLHGKSKSGHNLQRLLLEGIPFWINNGQKIQAQNPVDGKLYKFIVVMPQAPSWGLKPAEIETLLNDIEPRYRIDRSRIYITGYSAGGWATVMALTESVKLASRFAAAVPMSASAIDKKNLKQFRNVADANTHAWYLAGAAELHFLEECRRYVDSTNVLKPGLAKMTVIEGFGHHSWKTLYDPRNKPDNVMSIYEWMLQFQRTTALKRGRNN